jgi:VCBS repeat-containing protein
VDNPYPEANSDTGTTDEETPITVDDQNGVLSNDSDTDADDIFVEQVNGDPGNVGISVDGGNGGSFTLNADGSYSFDPEDDFQDLAEGETADTTINYTISDGEGGTSSSSLTVTVNGVNDLPDALDDTATTGEDSPINVDQGNGLLTNDSDPDTSDNLTVTEIGNGTDTEDVENGGTGISGNNGGTFTIDPDGSYTFDPGSDFQDLDDGETRETSITYTIDDGNGGTDEATLTITVTGANDAPSPEGTIGDQTNLDADEIDSVDVSGAFSDADGDTLSYTATELPQGLTIDPSTGVISGTIDNSASQEGAGGVYSVTVTASDGDESTDQTFTWTVNNPDPAAVDDTGKT